MSVWYGQVCCACNYGSHVCEFATALYAGLACPSLDAPVGSGGVKHQHLRGKVGQDRHGGQIGPLPTGLLDRTYLLAPFPFIAHHTHC
jgi:hypothetical protein